ncbi:MAG TPA: type IV toxin-antitoxin system AbiEi family antitoxin domain-containing protein [Solirubrobacterales bacterium]|nr:type IV toxin-antitoxin system AbiEi family antitoxin domain-containing protein [Solirubrobacterales bacterium]
MARRKSNASRRAWGLAARQHGVVARRQLLALGFGEEAIEHRLAKGRLHRISPGVYAVGWPGMTRERRWMAAILACGEGAVLSHRSAATLWGVDRKRDDRIDVSVRRRCEHRRAGLRVRSRPSLPESDVAKHMGIPVTTPARTLLDLATELDLPDLERAVNDADKQDLIGPDDLREDLERFAGEPGVQSLRTLLDRDTFRLSDSDLERLFRPIAAAAGLPPPETKVWVNGFEVDFFWPDLGLVVETDGLRYHRTAAAQTKDHLRDQVHTAAGLATLRFTYRQVKYEPAHVKRILTPTAQRLKRPLPDLPGLEHR